MEKSQITPTHLGIIADGNRRWAKEQGLPTIEGHKKGLDTIEMLISEFAKTDVKYLTFYVFSTENWSRSDDEVSYIMKLAGTNILRLAKKMAKNNVKLVILGSKAHVEPKLMSLIEEAERLTADCTGITACFCFNYGGEQEIVDAAKKMALSIHPELGYAPTAEELDTLFTPENFRTHLYHPEIPPCDMIVRTSGEERISGFMLYRAAYAEFLFLKKYFPAMTATDVQDILAEYQNRQRRFGK